MNWKLKRVADGKEAEAEIATWPGYPTHRQHLIYWPFGIRRDEGYWALTHLPSGYKMRGEIGTKQKAQAIVRKLRASGLDFNFTSPDGRKFAAIKQRAKELIFA